MKKCPSPVSSSLLQQSNEVWNQLQLNSPWSVGMVSHLIRQEEFDSYESWFGYYYDSGCRRSEAMSHMSHSTRYILNFIGPRSAKALLKHDYAQYNSVQYNYGRTRSTILHRSSILRSAMSASLTLNQAFQLIEYRVLGETWNGIYIREKSFEKAISERYSSVDLRHVDGALDYRYGIDYEVFIESGLRCAIQVKPESYNSNRSYVKKAKAANHIKNKAYTDQSGKPVFTILISDAGAIIEDDQYQQLALLLTKRP